MLSGLASEEITGALDAVAEGVLEQAGVLRPPVDAFALADSLGIVVANNDRQPERARYVRLARPRPLRPQPTILVRSDPRCERRQWAVAHEIGEHVACRVFGLLGIAPCEAEPKIREEVANRLAGRLLAPGKWLAPDAAECDWDLLSLKARYRSASHELLARRMLEFPVPVIITIFDQGRISWRRSNVPGRVPPPSAAELECRRKVHCRGLPRQANEGPSQIQGWPVHEEQWKREIIRREVELGDDCCG